VQAETARAIQRRSRIRVQWAAFTELALISGDGTRGLT
jgi:hypothetical protein